MIPLSYFEIFLLQTDPYQKFSQDFLTPLKLLVIKKRLWNLTKP